MVCIQLLIPKFSFPAFRVPTRTFQVPVLWTNVSLIRECLWLLLPTATPSVMTTDYQHLLRHQLAHCPSVGTSMTSLIPLSLTYVSLTPRSPLFRWSKTEESILENSKSVEIKLGDFEVKFQFSWEIIAEARTFKRSLKPPGKKE